MSGPVGVIARIRYCCYTTPGLSESLSGYNICHSIPFFSTACRKIQHFFPHGYQITHIDLLSGIFLSRLDFQDLICSGKTPEQRMYRFSYLEIYGAVFDLQDHILCKLSVQRCKIIISRTGAICLLISPVLLAVVDKAPPDDRTAIRRHRFCQHICSVCMISAISKGTGTAF